MQIRRIFFGFFTVIISTAFILIIIEIILRNIINFEMDYYYGTSKLNNKNIINHPYGSIPVNKDGFFDSEFEFEDKKIKIGYFGDSVTYGVGAGFPYRFTEYLDELDPDFDHLNLSGGLGVSLIDWGNKINEFLLKKNINRIVYIMNLNDIAPLSNRFLKNKSKDEKIDNLGLIKKLALPIDKIFRGKSMVYTYSRFKLKNLLVKSGYEASGFKSMELFPSENLKHINNAAAFIDDWSIKMSKLGIKTCVVLIPYEMQISKNASEYYKSIGIKFENSFENFSTQKLLVKGLNSSIVSFYVKEGFEEKNIGYYFVFNKGDKIDFNHPNRKGHFVIANQISKNKICQK